VERWTENSGRHQLAWLLLKGDPQMENGEMVPVF